MFSESTSNLNLGVLRCEFSGTGCHKGEKSQRKIFRQVGVQRVSRSSMAPFSGISLPISARGACRLR